MKTLQRSWPLLALAATLVCIVLLQIKPYAFNVTTVFHMDARTAEGNPMPPGFVILDVPSYDGAQYYHIARNIPKIANPMRWATITPPPGSYAYQRFLLPLTAYVISLGNIALLPWIFLLINVASLLGAAALILRNNEKHWLYAMALALSPAAVVALHFSLAEPLTILLITAFLLRYTKRHAIGMMDILLLSGLVLSREVNILFVGFVLGFSLFSMRWRDAAMLLIPAMIFVGWHAVIYEIFGNVPFLMSAEAKELPGSAALRVVLGMRGYDRYTISSAVLFVGFVIPGVIWTCMNILKQKRLVILSSGALVFFGVMLVMPDYIWGSITSIGRVITPVYPLFLLQLAERDTLATRALATILLCIGLGASVGLALSVHPYHLTSTVNAVEY